MENEEPKTTVTNPIPAPTAPTVPVVANEQKKGFMPKKTLIFIAVLAIITVTLLVFSLTLKTSTITQQKPTAVNKPVVNHAQSNLSLSTPTISTTSAYTSNVEITTGNNKVTGVDIRLSYDPRVLTNVEIKPGTFFTNPIILYKKIDAAKALVSYTIAASTNQKSATGKGVVAIVSFSRINNTLPIQVNFLPETEVTAIGYASSVLNTSSGLTFTTK